MDLEFDTSSSSPSIDQSKYLEFTDFHSIWHQLEN